MTPEQPLPEVAPDDRCTPEKLEAFVRASLSVSGRFPSLQELKNEYGGVLGPLVDSWELDRRGVLARLKRLVASKKMLFG
jgi:hypothetical protein